MCLTWLLRGFLCDEYHVTHPTAQCSNIPITPPTLYTGGEACFRSPPPRGTNIQEVVLLHVSKKQSVVIQ